MGLKREEPTEDGLDVHRHAVVVTSRASAAPAGNVAHAPFQTLRRERRAKLATLRDGARRRPRAPPERRARRTPSQTVGDGVQERDRLRRLARLIPREPPRELVGEGREQLARHRLGIHRELENHRKQPAVDEVERGGFARVVTLSRRRTPRVPPNHQQRRRVQKFRGGNLRRAIRRRQRQRRRARQQRVQPHRQTNGTSPGPTARDDVQRNPSRRVPQRSRRGPRPGPGPGTILVHQRVRRATRRAQKTRHPRLYALATHGAVFSLEFGGVRASRGDARGAIGCACARRFPRRERVCAGARVETRVSAGGPSIDVRSQCGDERR